MNLRIRYATGPLNLAADIPLRESWARPALAWLSKSRAELAADGWLVHAPARGERYRASHGKVTLTLRD